MEKIVSILMSILGFVGRQFSGMFPCKGSSLVDRQGWGLLQ